MASTDDLLQANIHFSKGMLDVDPEFFKRLSEQQKPDFLWIGCSDSRVPASEITGLGPGGLFVHRNVSNVVSATDLNCLSTIQFAVDALRVHHIIVCGHYGCGGVTAVLDNDRSGGIDYWLQPIRNLYYQHQEILDAVPDKAERIDRLSELNVLQQAYNVCNTTIVRDTWEKKLWLEVHAWIYGLKDGLIHDLGMGVRSAKSLDETFAKATQKVLDKCKASAS